MSNQRDRLLESSNDQLVEQLAAKVGRIKNITLDMHGDIEQQNRDLDDMNVGVDSLQQDIKRTVHKLRIVLSQPYYRNILYVSGAVVCLFLLYKII